MTVSGLDGGSVEDEDYEQQTEATPERGALILNCVDQHAGHYLDMLESGSFGIVLRATLKTQFELVTKFPEKAQRRKVSFWFSFSLRLCVFAGNAFFLLCLSVVGAKGNERSRVTISIPAPGQVKVEAECPPTRSWSFRNAYAGVLGIAERIEGFRALADSGQDSSVRKSAAGEFRSELDARRISYIVRLSEPRPAEVSHASWLVGDRGFLMFADLVPLDIESLSAEFILPAGWTVESSIPREANGHYQISDAAKSVFFIGRSLRKASKNIEGMILETVLSGAWTFKDGDALKAAGRVMQKYLALTGFRLPGKSMIMIAPLPVGMGSTRWKAETRGSTIVLLIDPSAPIENWIGQLGVIFTHEILHLWVPNSLKLGGDYDWFFEGFTLYIALRTALELKIINFKEFLNTLARVYDSYLSYADDLSLIEAAERRWTTPGSLVYDKGMLIAFLYDLIVRKESAGKATLADRYLDLFNGAVTDNANGNEVIIRMLASSPAVKDFAKSYIENSRQLELEQVLPTYGLELDSSGKSSQLRVSVRASAEQKRLLRSLGYRD